MSIREQLDHCWQFVDKYKWGAICSASKADNISISYVYFVRHNDMIFIKVPEWWRHLENIKNDRVISFLISNTEVFDTQPEEYSRLFIQGKLTLFPKDSEEYKKLISIHKNKFPNDPLIPLYLGFLKPLFIEFHRRPSQDYSKPKEITINLDEKAFNTNGVYKRE